MKILFVVHKDFLYFEPLGIMSLSSILKKAGHDNINIVEATYPEIEKKIKNSDESFVLLAYSTHSYMSSYYLNLNREIKKEFKVFSVFGGPHPTYYPEIIQEPGVDGVCVGEGDYALLDLVDNLVKKKPVAHIPNWWIKQDGQIFQNSPRPLIKNLDTLPFADRMLFPGFNRINIITSRGCPYNCSFCQAKAEFRRRSVDNVIAELKEIKIKVKARFVFFIDSIFNHSLSWLKEFSEKYRKEIGLPFYCDVRADLMTEECAAYLKEAGCFSVGMGIETANDYLRNEILEKGISREQITSAAKVLRSCKIRLMTFNVIGMPLSSFQDDLETLKLNMKLRPDYAQAMIFSLYKNTDIYQSLSKADKIHPKVFFKDSYLNLDSYGFISNRLEIKKLHKLFSFTAKLPFLFPLIPYLIKLPFLRFYTFFFDMWEGYWHYFKIRGGNLLGWGRFAAGAKKYLRILAGDIYRREEIRG